MLDKILIIDNEFEIVEMLSEILSVHDYDIKTALDGENGIKLALNENHNSYNNYSAFSCI